MAGNVAHMCVSEQGAAECSSVRAHPVRWFDKLGQAFMPRRVERVISQPLTYVAVEGPRLQHYMLTGELAPHPRVQVRKRGVVLCGRVIEAAPAREDQDADWFKVDCYLGQLWFAGANVRLCSGLDGRCMCTDVDEAPEGARACAGAPGASTVPPGNTGTTVVGGA